MYKYFGGGRIYARHAWCAALLSCLLSHPAAAQNEDGGPVKKYRTQDERLEAGLQRRLTEWLTLTTLAEYEWGNERRKLDTNSGVEEETSSALTLETGLTASPVDWLQADLEVEYDSEDDDVIVDEAVLAAEWEPFELEVGKDSLAFGEYFSRFTTDPLLEFGEVTETAITLSYNLDDVLELSASAYRGRARSAGQRGSDIDYVIAGELWSEESLTMGMSYITDLADSDEKLLSDTSNFFQRKVPALSGYVLWKGGKYEATFEYSKALTSFLELDRDRDQPSAWNTEVVLYVLENVDLAFRIEGSDELEDAPALRGGVAVTWLVHDKATVTLEALRGRFKKEFVTDDEDNAFETSDTIALQLLLAF